MLIAAGVLAAVVGISYFIPALVPFLYVPAVVAMMIVGFTSGIFFLTTWGFHARRAVRHGRLTISTVALLDFVGFPALATFVLGLNLYTTWRYGVNVDIPDAQQSQRLATLLVLTLICSVRAVRWLRMWIMSTDDDIDVKAAFGRRP